MLRAHAVDGQAWRRPRRPLAARARRSTRRYAPSKTPAWLPCGMRSGPAWTGQTHVRTRGLGPRAGQPAAGAERGAIATQLAQEHGLVVHRRTVERLLTDGRKKRLSLTKLSAASASLTVQAPPAQPFWHRVVRRSSATRHCAPTWSYRRPNEVGWRQPVSGWAGSIASACLACWTAIPSAGAGAAARWSPLRWN